MASNPHLASTAARERGCTCPRTTNEDGRGIVNPEDGKRYWVVDGDCPLHGYGPAVPDEKEEQP